MRRGIALPAMLFVLTLVSALAVSGVYAARRLGAIQRDGEAAQRVELAVEQALVDAVVGWDSTGRALQPIGAVAPLATADSSSTNVSVWVTRIARNVYWIVAEASDAARIPLHRRIGLLIHVVAGVPEAVPERAWTELP